MAAPTLTKRPGARGKRAVDGLFEKWRASVGRWQWYRGAVRIYKARIRIGVVCATSSSGNNTVKQLLGPANDEFDVIGSHLPKLGRQFEEWPTTPVGRGQAAGSLSAAVIYGDWWTQSHLDRSVDPEDEFEEMRRRPRDAFEFVESRIELG